MEPLVATSPVRCSGKRISAFYRREMTLWWTGSAIYTSLLSSLAAAAYFFVIYLNSFQARSEQYRAGFLGTIAEGISQTGELSLAPSLREMVLEPYFQTVGFLLVFILPLWSSKLFCEERQSGSFDALFSLPCTVGEIVTAKFLAAMTNLVLLVTILSAAPLFLVVLTSQPFLPVFFGGIALVLLSAAYLSLGMGLSQVCRNSFAFALTHFLLLMVLYFLPALPPEFFFGFGGMLRTLSPVPYTTEMTQGFFSTTQLAYFLGVSAAGLVFAVLSLSQERYEQ
ncbi:ABC transporter permease [bacterium]|nr:ABC transporter permease [bacterium]